MSYFSDIEDKWKAKRTSAVKDAEFENWGKIIPATLPVNYDDASHTYTLNKQKYTGASSLAEHFCEPFPADAHIKYAEKHGNTPEYWKAKWEEKNLLSRVRGNRIHSANETVLHGRQIDIFNGQQVPVVGEWVTPEIPWMERPDGVYTEQLLWHHGYKLAGRVDKTILLTQFYEELPPMTALPRYAHIDDYKSNERINFTSFQYRNGNYKMMKYPVAHLMDCNWIHYCIQQSAYMLMLEYQGFIPGTMFITHYPHPTDENPKPEKIKYPVPYMKKEVVQMCQYLNR